MEQLLTILGVAVLFLVRIGVPVLVLIGVGLLVDHWQSKRDESLLNEINKQA